MSELLFTVHIGRLERDGTVTPVDYCTNLDADTAGQVIARTLRTATPGTAYDLTIETEGVRA